MVTRVSIPPTEEGIGIVTRAAQLAERERLSLGLHGAVMRGASRPPSASGSAHRSFLHGFLLPFTLILTVLRHPTVGWSYLKITVVRALVVGLLAALVIHNNRDRIGAPTHAAPAIHVKAASPPKRVHVNLPGAKVDIDPATGEKKATILGADVPIVDDGDAGGAEVDEETRASKDAPAPSLEPAPSGIEKLVSKLTSGWKFIVWFVGIVSATEGFIAFVSRKYDDWLGFWAAPLAAVRPEDPFPKHPKLSLDLRYVIKKLKRRARGYLVFGAGIPLIAVFKLIPSVGDVLFSVGLTVWGWYWLAVFTAAKSAHAWADDARAPSPLLIREIRDGATHGPRWLAPFALYGRLWGRLTKSLNAPAQVFERNPAPFLGMALARAILSLPGLYLLARPIVPIAVGRIIAESDPTRRFGA